ncbi:hypothetical protein JX265_007187 [Neoarthrinium moseri]|uniref:Uncharacterized protein n=1 Tax=Neoarthrinium moseri TaxID=1658444 RepID=A0A9Q0ANL6_9PEZI|nr:hypothetical protein JX265_007187 [Neoarthrinium moseri]
MRSLTPLVAAQRNLPLQKKNLKHRRTQPDPSAPWRCSIGGYITGDMQVCVFWGPKILYNRSRVPPPFSPYIDVAESQATTKTAESDLGYPVAYGDGEKLPGILPRSVSKEGHAFGWSGHKHPHD